MRIEARAYTVPTDAPESDGTLEWDSTTIVIVEVEGDGELGLGYTYSHAAVGVVESVLAPIVEDADPMAPPESWARMRRAVRNLGGPGIAPMVDANGAFGRREALRQAEVLPISASSGSRSPSPPRTSKASPGCATASRRGSGSRRASTSGTRPTRRGWRPASTSSKSTRPAASASPGRVSSRPRPGIPGLYVTEDPGAESEEAKKGNLSLSLGTGWAKSLSFVTGQCPAMKYHRELMHAILNDRCEIAKAVNATVIKLDEAPQGYEDFDQGAAKKFVIDPHGLISA